MDYKIYPGVWIADKIDIGYGTAIGVNGAIRGCKKWYGEVHIGERVFIGANVTIAKGRTGETIIGDDTILMNNCLIGHNVEIGEWCEIGGGVMVAGHTKIGNNVRIKMGAVIRNRIQIVDDVTIGMGAVVTKDILKKGSVWYGNPAKEVI